MIRIALVSLNQSWLDKESNFMRCAELVKTAAEHNCGLIIFPEMTLTSFSLDTLEITESIEKSETLQKFAQLASNSKTDIIFGACIQTLFSRKPQNTLCLASRSGEVNILYSKIHPFSYVEEDSIFQAGDTLGFTSVEGLKIGCSICYDLRFPEIFSVMAPNCNAVINIANWPNSRIAHWRGLLVARAIENQFFVFGVNRVGTDGNGLQYEESSMSVAPDGAVLKPIFKDEEIAIYDIDPMETERYREAFPTVRDKRYEIYRKLYEGLQVAK